MLIIACIAFPTLPPQAVPLPLGDRLSPLRHNCDAVIHAVKAIGHIRNINPHAVNFYIPRVIVGIA